MAYWTWTKRPSTWTSRNDASTTSPTFSRESTSSRKNLKTTSSGSKYLSLKTTASGRKYLSLKTTSSGSKYLSLKTTFSGRKYRSLKTTFSGSKYQSLKPTSSGSKYLSLKQRPMEEKLHPVCGYMYFMFWYFTNVVELCCCRGASNSVAAAGSVGSAECSQISAKEVDLHSGEYKTYWDDGAKFLVRFAAGQCRQGQKNSILFCELLADWPVYWCCAINFQILLFGKWINRNLVHLEKNTS